MTTTASAPGKVMLAGEYAVLHGHPAVLATVDRRVVARVDDAPPSSDLLSNLAEILEREAHQRSHLARDIAVDSTALFDKSGERKLGLGSSAAVAVAAAALALNTDEPHRVIPIALEAHARTQAAAGARGSGVDIAASAVGGVCAVRAGGVEPFDILSLSPPKELDLLLVWTGRPASTPQLVATVSRHRGEPAYTAAIAALAAATRHLIDAFHAGDPARCLAAIHIGADAHAQLAAATAAELITPAHRQIRALAASRGGAAKPTGAGGGDICLAAFTDAAAAAAFRRDIAACTRGNHGDHEIEVLDTTIASTGLRLHRD